MEEVNELKEETTEIKHEDDNPLRIIFLTLLKIFFITLMYVYLSDRYGSVSSSAIGFSEFFPFVASLFALAFLSKLAGVISGAISGFLGESLYQLAFYGEIYIHWCIILAVFGGICGLVKFKSLKRKDNKDILYKLLELGVVELSFASLPAILILSSLESVIVMLNFFIQFLISVLFFVPLILFFYDKILSDKERHIYHEFLTHHPHSAKDHTFYLQFGRTHIYFCTRCSGFVIGALFSMFITYLITLIFKIDVSPEIALLLCIILPIPGLIDWGTQRLMLRKSTTESRLFTGFIIGIALHYISFTKPYGTFLFLITVLYFGIFFTLMYFGAKKEMRLWKEEWDQLSDESDELLDESHIESDIQKDEEIESE
jgi:uncharacterized membrane protein